MKVKDKKTALIVGGSSGLGLSLGKKLSKDYFVIVTGRRDPQEDGLRFVSLDFVRIESLPLQLDELISSIGRVDLLVYAAGFYQEGTLDQLSDDDIFRMSNVGFIAPALLLRRLLEKQKELPEYIAITSTSEFTPRKLEPVYAGVKAGLGMLSQSLAYDERIGKTLIVAPGGMNTRFWDEREVDRSKLLDPIWVADEILKLFDGHYGYRYAKIFRNPQRVEVVETK